MKELRSAVGQAAPVVLRRANEVLRVVVEASEGEVCSMIASKALSPCLGSVSTACLSGLDL